jgi:hypothetical protein
LFSAAQAGEGAKACRTESVPGRRARFS